MILENNAWLSTSDAAPICHVNNDSDSWGFPGSYIMDMQLTMNEEYVRAIGMLQQMMIGWKLK